MLQNIQQCTGQSPSPPPTTKNYPDLSAEVRKPWEKSRTPEEAIPEAASEIQGSETHRTGHRKRILVRLRPREKRGHRGRERQSRRERCTWGQDTQGARDKDAKGTDTDREAETLGDTGRDKERHDVGEVVQSEVQVRGPVTRLRERGQAGGHEEGGGGQGGGGGAGAKRGEGPAAQGHASARPGPCPSQTSYRPRRWWRCPGRWWRPEPT